LIMLEKLPFFICSKMRLFNPFFFDPFDSKFDFLNKYLIFDVFYCRD
jgi:hypothetical protein